MEFKKFYGEDHVTFSPAHTIWRRETLGPVSHWWRTERTKRMKERAPVTTICWFPGNVHEYRRLRKVGLQL